MNIWKSSDRCYLASYPKSGNTWVRFVLGNLYNILEYHVEEVSFHNIQELIPETDKPKPFPFTIRPEVMKTHNRYKKKYDNVILVVRNPIDVINSFYYYLTQEKEKQLAFSSLLRDDKRGLSAIMQYVNEYVKNTRKLFILSYEQMHEMPERHVADLCKFMGLQCSEQEIIRAVELASFNNMRRVEDEHGRPYAKTDFKFTRKGRVGEGIEKLSLSDKAWVNKKLLESPLLGTLYRDYY